ncbi:MAG: agmatine deiminase [Paraglaciecola sp.]|jgi:agmatine deiminase
MTTTSRLLPEWAPQEAIILAWPDSKTDWQPWLHDVREVYIEIISAINRGGTGVLLLIREGEIAIFRKLVADNAQVILIRADYNDTWVRDYAYLTCSNGKGMQPIEFVFNGWGNKFNADKDNLINRQILANLCELPLQSFDYVVEGGALEIDQHGQLLSTQFCLSNPQRNGDMSLAEYRDLFKTSLGATRISIFEWGHLQGDDTDGHIDTLVRFTPDNGLLIQSAYNRPKDIHYKGLAALVRECQSAFPEHQIYQLPLPNILNQDGERLPASYANFLINNQQVLCPTYNEPEDSQALAILASAYPSHKIVAVNCLALIQQFGSLHCISMQVPAGTLKSEVHKQFKHGVSLI